jgi:hypothetical protein
MIEFQDLTDLINNNFNDKEKISFLAGSINKNIFKGWEAYFDESDRQWRLSKNVKNRGWPKNDNMDYEDAHFLFDGANEELNNMLKSFPSQHGFITIEPSGRSGGHWCLKADFPTLIEVLFDVKPVIDLDGYDYDYDSNKSIWDADFQTINEIIQVEPNDNFYVLEDAWEDKIKGIEEVELEDNDTDDDYDDDDDDYDDSEFDSDYDHDDDEWDDDWD